MIISSEALSFAYGQDMNKRKEITDFFAPQASKKAKSIRAEQVPGLEIKRDFITLSEEASILSFLSTQTFRNDLQRRCLHFGGPSRLRCRLRELTVLRFLLSIHNGSDSQTSSLTS